jgi:hypothetical protein
MCTTNLTGLALSEHPTLSRGLPMFNMMLADRLLLGPHQDQPCRGVPISNVLGIVVRRSVALKMICRKPISAAS